MALHVLIRPRAGGFYYTDDEFDIIQRDIIAARMAGADGKLSNNGRGHCVVRLLALVRFSTSWLPLI